VAAVELGGGLLEVDGAPLEVDGELTTLLRGWPLVVFELVQALRPRPAMTMVETTAAIRFVVKMFRSALLIRDKGVDLHHLVALTALEVAFSARADID